MKHLAIFASGGGSNAREIIRYFKDHSQVKVALVLSNKADAGALNWAKEAAIPTIVLDRKPFYDDQSLLASLRKFEIDALVLAGFLWLVPDYLIDAYPNAIINIHPALLPDYGGKGMYGMHVHKAVFKAKERISGISIHLVDEEYDKGKIIFQASCDISEAADPSEVAKKVLELEHKHFAKVIEKLLLQKNPEA